MGDRQWGIREFRDLGIEELVIGYQLSVSPCHLPAVFSSLLVPGPSLLVGNAPAC
jgi:hypothetical protein